MSNPKMNFIFIAEVSQSNARLERNEILNLLLLKVKRENRYLQSGSTDYYFFTCFQIAFRFAAKSKRKFKIK